MTRRLPKLAAAALLVLAASCSTDRPSPTAVGGAALRISNPDLDVQITALLQTVFPTGLSNASLARWSNVKRQVAANQHETVKGTTQPAAAGRKQLANLVRWIDSKKGSITPPSGETTDHVVGRIALYMSLYVYGGPTTTPPDLTGSTDIAFGIVTPDAPATIQTPTLHAGVAFPQGAVDEATVVVVEQNTTPFLTPCTGPLPTTLCQYPQFYKFNVFPDVRLNHSATVAVCHVNAGNFRNPREGIHDRFRFAHQAPVDPSARVQGGEIVDGIEILPTVLTVSVIDCSQNDSYFPNQFGSTDVLHRGLNQLARVANAIGRVISPKNAWAIDQGAGGLVDIFSDFNVVDPDGVPVLRITGLTASNVQPFPGDSLILSPFTIANVGDANAGQFQQTFFIATDTTLTTGATALTGTTNYGGINVGGAFFLGSTNVFIPASQAPGTYYIGVRLEAPPSSTNPRPQPAYLSVQITVVSPGVIGNTP